MVRRNIGRSCSALILGLLVMSQAFGEGIGEYMRLRAKNGITKAMNFSGLDTFVGTRVVELKGVVRGVAKANGKSTAIIEDGEGVTAEVDLPDSNEEWLTGGEVSARMLVRATRTDPNSSVKKVMIAAAPESEVARREPREVVYTEPDNPLRGAIGKHGKRKPVATKMKPMSSGELIKVYANFIQNWNRKVSRSSAEHIANAVLGYSVKYGVDARLIMAIVMTESDFNINEHSHAGAMGLGQLMPVNQRELGLTNAYDIYQNLYGTVVLVRGHLDKYRKQTSDDVQSLSLALAGYNAGDGAVKKYGGIPPYRETQNYVKKVIYYYRRLCGTG